MPCGTSRTARGYYKKDGEDKATLENAMQDIIVYPTLLNKGHALTIISPANARLEIYTIDGKKLGNYNIEKGKQQMIPEHTISSQMLMLRFYMSDGSITFRKVMLN